MRVGPAVLAIALLLAPAAAGQPGDRSVLLVFAHPDDEIVVAPLAAHYAREKVRIHLAIVTDGAKGGDHGLVSVPALAQARAEEARCSCRALGIEPPILLGFSDGELGSLSHPPWQQLSQVEQALRKVFADIRPEIVITWGPEGGYGHPDHRLVGALVTQLVQARVVGAPTALFYPGFPADRLGDHPAPKGVPWSPTEPGLLTVRIPYDSADWAATQKAMACHRSQFSALEAEADLTWLHEVLGGRVFLRPWIGEASGDDLFRSKISPGLVHG